MSRLPRTLLGNRIRTSTLGLLVLFLAVLAVYVAVRPVPAPRAVPAAVVPAPSASAQSAVP